MPKAFCIRWIDAKTWANAWMDEEEIKQLALPEYVTYGVVIKEDRTSIFLAQTIGDECRNIIGIHKGCILNKKKIHD